VLLVPLGSGELVDIMIAGLTVRVKPWVTAAFAASVAVTVKVAVAALIGTPEIMPVFAASDSPAGRDPAVIDQV